MAAASRALLAVALFLAVALLLAGYGPVTAAAQEGQLVRTSPSDLAATEGYTLDCGGACAARCRRSWKPKMCMKMCTVCCRRCNCVPPGTGVETRAMCPCYANMRSPQGKLKCP